MSPTPAACTQQPNACSAKFVDEARRCANMTAMTIPLISNELDLLQSLVPLADARIVEAGCGAALLARELVGRHPTTEVVGIDVDEQQLAKNLLTPIERLRFEKAGAQSIPFPDASFDGALMLKSLHHVPMSLMDQALAELARVLRPGGWLYASEPVYAGELNELMRLFNDEGEVRAAAQAALDRAVASGHWASAADQRFESPVAFGSFDEFEQRMMRPTFADHGIDQAMLERVRSRYLPHQGPGGASFTRPMHARVLRKAL
jgi:ubiquinone/menaquinone biosynthesis C-methylase UbiE